MSDDGYTRITLRIPDDLHARLTDAAARASKSMNAEIVARLEAAEGFEDERQRMQLAVDTIANALQASHRMLALTGFYLRSCAERVPRNTEQTRELMENIERFANSLYHGDMDPSALRNIIDMGVRDGIIDPETRQARPEYKIDHPAAAQPIAKRPQPGGDTGPRLAKRPKPKR